MKKENSNCVDVEGIVNAGHDVFLGNNMQMPTIIINNGKGNEEKFAELRKELFEQKCISDEIIQERNNTKDILQPLRYYMD